MWVHDLGAADVTCGGKAEGLARLIAAGVQVPAGFVIDGGAFRAIVGDLDPERADIGLALAQAADRIARVEIPRELADEVRERVGELGTLVAVRSSATIEDGAAGSGAGVFSSRRGVPIGELWDAIRAVWTSALTPLAAAYARRRGARINVGVIVQEYVAGTPITVYTRPPGAPGADELMVQRGDLLSRHSRIDLPREIETQHAAVIALRAEAAIGATGGADVELVQLRKQHGFDLAMQTWVVQARPVVHPTPKRLTPPPPSVLAPLQDGRRWTWDVSHNPDPLSTAQQSLVERVADIGPWPLKVVSGFLYSTPLDAPRPHVTTKHDLSTRAAEIEARCERALAGAGAGDGDGINRFVAFYRIWASELAPLIATARTVLPAELRAAGHAQPEGLAASLIGRRPSAVEVMLAAAARGELTETEVTAELGPLAPAWDVAVPTFAERHGSIRDAIARARAADELSIRLRRPTPQGDQSRASAARLSREAAIAADHERAVELARAAADLAERDDLLFARAQWLVRQELLTRGAALGIGDDIFWIPLGDSSTDVDELRRRASGARAAAARAAQWQMPLVVGGANATESPELRGVGTGPKISGRVVRFASLASAISVGHGDVVVTRAVTPALAVVVAGCAAVVSETGGLLDHGASLARELGVPCVVGCRDAWSLLSDGMLVTVDGDGGAVTVQSSSS
jgi:pyruvate,water dikinase